jgi:predicted DNA-binding ribbon-helix-helix protein
VHSGQSATVSIYSGATLNLLYEDKWVRELAGGLMKSLIVKHTIIIDGHKTSVSLEGAFWNDLKKIAHAKEATLTELVAEIDQAREQGNLSSAIRLYVLEHFRRAWAKGPPLNNWRTP